MAQPLPPGITSPYSLSLGTPVVGNLPLSSSRNWYSITAIKNGGLTVSWDGPTNSTLPYFTLSIINSIGAQIGKYSIGQDYSFSFGVLANQTYYLGVFDENNNFSSDQYSLAVTTAEEGAVYEMEFNNTLASANTITLNTPVYGQISSWDEKDWFAIRATSNGRFVVNWDAPTSSSQLKMFWFSLYDAQGILLSEYQLVGDNSFSFAGEVNQIYYIKLGQYQIGDTNQYSFSISKSENASIVEHEKNNTIITSNQIELEIPIIGQLYSDADQDWFSCVAPSDAGLIINWKGRSSTVYGSSADTIAVYDSKGVLQASYLVALEKSLSFGSVANQIYYIGITRYGYNTYDPGEYQFSVSTVSDSSVYEYEQNDTISSANRISLSVPILGQLSSTTDQDWFVATAPSTGGIKISAAKLQGKISIYDASGVLQATYETSWLGESTISIAAKDNKNYYLNVSTSNIYNKEYSITISEANDVNFLPTGNVTISGDPIQGGRLTATNTLADADGVGLITYSWISSFDGGLSWNQITTGNSIILSESQVGKQIGVLAIYNDKHNWAEQVKSIPTSSVSNLNDLPTGSVIISGNLIQGQNLKASNTLIDIDGLGIITYQWWAKTDNEYSWTELSQGESIKLNQSVVGKRIIVQALYTDGHGTAESSQSAMTVPISNINDAPEPLAATIMVNEDVSIKGVLTGADLDNDPLTFAKVMGPIHGTLLISPLTGAYTYTPTANYNGADSFTFKVNDGTLDSAEGTVLLTINAVNDAPTLTQVLSDQQVSENQILKFTFALSSFADVDDSSLVFTAKLDSGLSLPDWVIFNPNDLSFVTSPPETVVDTVPLAFTIQVTAIDAAGASVSDNFDLIVKPSGYNIYATATFWKGALLSSNPTKIAGVNLIEGGKNGISDTTGLIALIGALDTDGANDGNMILSPQLDVPSNAKSAITLTDVLATLKVYLNKPLPDAFASPLNYIAADFDGSGTVTLTDVLQLLKYYLNKPTTVKPTWQFVDAADMSSDGKTFVGNNGDNLAKDNTSPHAIDQTFDATHMSIQLVGVLRGDVDGSWAA